MKYRFSIPLIVCALSIIIFSIHVLPDLSSGLWGNIIEKKDVIKTQIIENVYSRFPSPHAELIIGMTIGEDLFYKVPRFKSKLRETGTIHVVVVSGFNIALVYTFVSKMIGGYYTNAKFIFVNVLLAFYVLIVGFDPPVVRAAFMGFLAQFASFTGREISAIRLILFSIMLMYLADREIFTSLSFILSYMATLGMIFLSRSLEKVTKPLVRLLGFFYEDFNASLSSFVLVWPVLAYTFSEMSYFSVFINTLILWTVPLGTILGFLFIALASLRINLTVLNIVIYRLLDFFVEGVSFFGSYNFIKGEVTISTSFLVIYYLIVLVILMRIGKRKSESKITSII